MKVLSSPVGDPAPAALVPRPRPLLVLVPHAGGTAWAYGGLIRRLRSDSSRVVVEYSGHGARRREPLARDLPELVDDALRQVADALVPGAPVVVAGHSMGALVALEVTRALERDGVDVTHLVVSGREPADLPTFWPPLHVLPAEHVADALTGLGGLPQIVRDDPGVMRLLLPAIVNDLRIAETSTVASAPAVGCPLTAIHGRSDELVRAATMPGWDRFAPEACEVVALDGGHMIAEHPRYAQVLDDVVTAVARPAR